MRARVPLLLGAFAWLTLRTRAINWGATPEDITRPLPGDGLIPDSPRNSTMVITIRARASEIWPWIAQMGRGRAGWYAYDLLLDNAGEPSAEEIHPEWQDVKAGDLLPSSERSWFEVVAAEPDRHLVLRGTFDWLLKTSYPSENGLPALGSDMTWAFVLQERSDGTTRLLTRVRGQGKPGWLFRAIGPFITDPGHVLMQRRQLHGIKRRAEAHAGRNSAGGGAPGALAPAPASLGRAPAYDPDADIGRGA